MDIQDTTAKTGLFGGIKAALFGEKGLFYPGSLKAFKEGWQEAEAESHRVLSEEVQSHYFHEMWDGGPDPFDPIDPAIDHPGHCLHTFYYDD